MGGVNERELLASYRPWLRAVAATMTTPDRSEEWAQEGWIALWKAWKSWPGDGDLDVWCKSAARRRMLSMLRDSRAAKRDLRVTQLTGDLSAVIEPSRRVDAAALAYHADEIAEALDRLTPRQRQYVVLRFWNEWTRTELDQHFHTRNSGAMWQTSRPKLAAALAHLKDVAA